MKCQILFFYVKSYLFLSIICRLLTLPIEWWMLKVSCFISDVIEMEDLKLVIDCNLQFISMQDFTTLRHSQY